MLKPSRAGLPAFLLAVFLSPIAHAAGPAAQKPDMAQALMRNAGALKQYSWTMRVEIILKGETRSTSLYKMRFDIDGKVQKTQISGGQSESRGGRRRGLGGRIRKKKTNEMQEKIQALNQTTMSYIYAHPTKFREFFTSAEIWDGRGAQSGQLKIQGNGFNQPDDSVVMWLDKPSRSPVKLDVEARFDDEPLLITADYRKLPDGPTYVARTTTQYPDDEIEIKVENFDYVKSEMPAAAPSARLSGSGQAAKAAGSVIPAGSELVVRLAQPLSSERNASGETFETILDDDVRLGQSVVLRRGSRLTGTLVEVKESGRVSGKARLSLALSQVYVGASPMAIRTNTIALQAEGSKGRDARRIATLAGAGAVIGAIAGGGSGAAKGAAVGGGAGGVITLVTAGKEIELGTEQKLSFRLLEPLQLPSR